MIKKKMKLKKTAKGPVERLLGRKLKENIPFSEQIKPQFLKTRRASAGPDRPLPQENRIQKERPREE